MMTKQLFLSIFLFVGFMQSSWSQCAGLYSVELSETYEVSDTEVTGEFTLTFISFASEGINLISIQILSYLLMKETLAHRLTL